MILRTAEIDGPGVQIVLEQEPGSAGKSVTAYLARRLAGFSVALTFAVNLLAWDWRSRNRRCESGCRQSARK